MSNVNTSEQTAFLESSRIPSWGSINPYRLQAVNRFAGQIVLDVGCSTGAYVQNLNSRNHNAFGVDLIRDKNWETIKPQTNLVGSVTGLPFRSKSVDTVLAFEILEHVPDYDKAIAEIDRVSKGNVILTVPDSNLPEDILGGGLVYSHWRDRSHCNFFTFESLEELLQRHGFYVELMRGFNPVRPEYIFLRSYHIPQSIAKSLTAILRRIPLRRAYNMTILAVANIGG